MRASVVKWAALGSLMGIFFAFYQVFGRNMYHGQEAAIDVVASAIEFGLIAAAVAAAKNWSVKRRGTDSQAPSLLAPDDPRSR